MQFTVLKLFNHKSLGLDAPHYAVVADMPLNMGGGRRVVDMFAAAEVESVEELRERFAHAKSNMPHRVSPEGGGEIDFYATDYKGNSVKQNTAYVPARSQTGERFEDGLLKWLSWRARVALWLQDAPRPLLDARMEARILEAVAAEKRTAPEPSLPDLRPGEAASPTSPVSQPVLWDARTLPPQRHDFLRGHAPAPLTPGLAPL